MADALHHFTLERSPDNATWTMLNASISPLPPYEFTDATAPGDSPTGIWYYRLTGYSALGYQIPYNVVSVTGPPNPNSGTCLLQRMFGGTTSSGGSTQRRIRIDSQGNIIIAGHQNQTVNYGETNSVSPIGSPDAFVAKYSPNGTLLWKKRFGNVSSDGVTGLAIDSLDHIIVTGSTRLTNFPGPFDVIIGPPDTSFTVDTYGQTDVLVAKFDSDGTLLRFKLFGGSGTDVGTGVAVDASDNIYLCGTYGFFGSGIDFGGGALSTFGTNARKVFMAKLDTNFAYVWQKGFGGTGENLAVDIAVSGSAVFFTGQFQGDSNFGGGSVTASGSSYDVFLAKYSTTDGSNTWQKVFGDAASPIRDQSAEGLAVDSTGAVILCGGAGGSGTMDFGGGHTFTAQAGGEFFVVKFTSGGTFSWLQHYGAPDNGPRVLGVAVDSSNNVYVTGVMTTGIDFGLGYLLNVGSPDFFALRMAAGTGATVWNIRANALPFGSGGSEGKAIAIFGSNVYFGADCGSNYGFDVGALQTMRTAGSANNNLWLKFVA